MPSIVLTLPVAGTQITAGLHATNYAAIQATLNGGFDNSNIAAGAGIAKSKLAALNIVDADVAAGAGIVKSKLAPLGLVDADIAAGANIAQSKLAPGGSTTIYDANVAATAAIALPKLASTGVIGASTTAITAGGVFQIGGVAPVRSIRATLSHMNSGAFSCPSAGVSVTYPVAHNASFGVNVTMGLNATTITYGLVSVNSTGATFNHSVGYAITGWYMTEAPS